MPDASGPPNNGAPKPEPPKKGPAARREAKRAFLRALAISQCVRKSAKQCGRSREWLYNQRAKDPKFCAKWNDVVRHRDAMLEDTCYSLAINGMPVPVVDEGKITDWYRKFFPKLITDLLRVTNPTKYHRSAIPPDEGQGGADVDGRQAAWRERLRQMAASVPPPPPPPPALPPPEAPPA